MNLRNMTDLELFHDAKIGVMSFDYLKKLAMLELFFDNPQKKGIFKLKVTNVYSMQIESYEPWGKGLYINEIKLDVGKEHNTITILINSGDTFIITAELFEIIK